MHSLNNSGGFKGVLQLGGARDADNVLDSN
jgi:hypothetical protein